MFHLNLLFVRLAFILAIGLVANKAVLAQTTAPPSGKTKAKSDQQKKTEKGDIKRPQKNKPKPKSQKKTAARKKLLALPPKGQSRQKGGPGRMNS